MTGTRKRIATLSLTLVAYAAAALASGGCRRTLGRRSALSDVNAPRGGRPRQ